MFFLIRKHSKNKLKFIIFPMSLVLRLNYKTHKIILQSNVFAQVKISIKYRVKFIVSTLHSKQF